MLKQDEDIYTFFEPELPQTKVTEGVKFPLERVSSS